MIHDFAYKSGESGIFKTGGHKIATTKLKTKLKKKKQIQEKALSFNIFSWLIFTKLNLRLEMVNFIKKETNVNKKQLMFLIVKHCRHCF